MSKEIKASGFESVIISSWEGWEGDQSYLQFFDCKLTKKYEEDLSLKKIDIVTFDLENGIVEFLDCFDPHMKPRGDYLFKRKYNLRISLGKEL